MLQQRDGVGERLQTLEIDHLEEASLGRLLHQLDLDARQRGEVQRQVVFGLTDERLHFLRSDRESVLSRRVDPRVDGDGFRIGDDSVAVEDHGSKCRQIEWRIDPLGVCHASFSASNWLTIFGSALPFVARIT